MMLDVLNSAKVHIAPFALAAYFFVPALPVQHLTILAA
jgi:hypothetical protein